MAKTWVPRNDVKGAKAFAKAMRLLLSSNKGRGRHNNNRPR